MTRVLLAALALAAGSRAGEPIRLSVQPMAAPKPIFRYRLLPEVRELSPGNPVQWYVRTFQERRNFFFGKEAVAERARYRSAPLAELPKANLRDYGGTALREADYAARLDTPDWEVLQRVQAEGADLRLAELPPLRVLAEALQVRFRAEVADRRFDDAVRTAKTMLALARHLGECPVGAANQTGLAVAQMALDTMEEMAQQSGCPNLYWALADLPSPLVDLRKGFQGDAILAEAEWRGLRDDPMTETELEEVIRRLAGASGFAREQAGRPPRSVRAALRSRAGEGEQVRAARARLVEAGASGAALGKLSAVQVILLDERRGQEARRDERLKLLVLPPGQAAGGPAGLFEDLLPDVPGARRVQGRLEQRVALLRCVEALRLYAAAHDGKLPARLSDCGVPLPADPFTGKPFRYELDGNSAHLRGGAKETGPEVDYLVTLRK
ncbi:MAG: hypothetical protein U0797_18015 [Gemmataceae bacterium]